MKIYELPNYRTDSNFSDQFKEERNKVSSGESLKAFVNRWEFLINDNNLDLEKVDWNKHFECFKCYGTNAACEHFYANDHGSGKCNALQFYLPRRAVEVFFLKREFIAPEYALLHQAYCDLEDHSVCFDF